ncbi:HNH endonuclease family protein [Kitasatospora sp. NPDC059327]|uniref:HNH endonuclease family protein n=1 Tax=Kitasatospora sp. NPDC059327 TaxID=3346803 RepID=UPI003685BF11
MPATRLATRLAAALVVTATCAVTAPPAPRPPLNDDQRLVNALPAAVTAPAPGYDRTLFGGWEDLDGDGCTARQAVLLRDLTEQATAQDRPTECTTVLSGRLTDPYTGVSVITDVEHVDIDHRVALRDAWAAGANTWTEQWRQDFANDEDNLLAVLPSVNRAKGSRGPDQWRPSGDKAARCAYAAGYARTKARWELGVTDAQRTALLEALNGC